MARQTLQHRQGKSGRFAGAGLRTTENILALQDDGNGLRLDGGRLRIAGVGDGLQQFGHQPEIFKFQRCGSCFGLHPRVGRGTGSGGEV